LAIFVGLSQDSEHPSAERLTQFVKLRQMVLQAKPQIENAGFTSKVLQRQQRIIERSLAFIDKVEASKGCSRSDLHDFIHEVLPAVIDNIKDAVALDLGALDAVMTQIKSQLTSDQWTKLHVIVCGAHMARTEESHMQYFLKLLEEQGEGRKLVYFEGNAEQQDAPLNSLGTHELDSQIGVAFFGDPERMHRDLLGPAASEYLDEHPVR
jgi:acetolactate synthase small subunit